MCLGRHSLLFAENGFNTYSFDLSEYGTNKLRDKSQERNLDINLAVGDILKLPYEDDFFDCL